MSAHLTENHPVIYKLFQQKEMLCSYFDDQQYKITKYTNSHI